LYSTLGASVVALLVMALLGVFRHRLSVRHVLWLIVLVGLLQPDITLANDYNRRFESTSEQLKCEKSILIFQRGSLFFIELK
jgi:1,4-dihydroxy-2-naphthoate octaprenyltransferase